MMDDQQVADMQDEIDALQSRNDALSEDNSALRSELADRERLVELFIDAWKHNYMLEKPRRWKL